MLVKPDVARRQLDAERAAASAADGEPSVEHTSAATTAVSDAASSNTEVAPPMPSLPKRFHGSVTLDPTRVGRDASRVADEVITHLAGLVGARVNITLEIEAEVPSGVPEKVVRTVTENSRTLKFNDHGFERE